MPSLSSKYRTHTCGELRPQHVGSTATLSGWVMRKRDHGGVVFVDLRDHYGITQVVFSEELGNEIDKIRVESVVLVRGAVVERAAELVNPKIETGAVELRAEALELLCPADVLPFQIAEDDNAPETTRLTYRFLELRREKLHSNIVLRSRVIKEIRDIMYGLGFNEFQTPILTSSSPEGARDFIVPSRLHPGKFFALPQAPQQFKQLLMVSGFDRYFQIAPCFRDEDARADRSPGEFYQVDMEMSFVEQEDVFAVGERLFEGIFRKFSNLPMNPGAPFPRIRYDDCLERYGTDKPDLRIDLEIEDVTSVFRESEFKVFRNVIDGGEKVRLLKIDLPQLPPRKYFDDTVEAFSKATGLGLAYVNFEKGEHKGTIAKFLKPSEIEELKTRTSGPATVMFFAAGAGKHVLPQLAKLRVKLGHDFGRIQREQWKFCWITDYPMFELNPDTNQIDFSHNPFSMPQGGLEALNSKDPLEVYANQYDLVCNGYEMLSGAIRNHVPEIMYRAFEIAGYTREDVDKRFGGMISAFKFGAPPHGGFAPGVDRIVMLLAREEAIRDVIAFPLTQQGEDLLMGAPSPVSEKQLREAHIAVRLPEQTKPAA